MVLTASIVFASGFALAQPQDPASTRPARWTNPIEKKGYLNSPLVEVTPFVFNNRLYRLESWQKYWEVPGLPPPGTRAEEDTVRMFDVEAERIISTPLTGHGFATAFVWDGRVYVFAAQWDRPNRKASKINMTQSADLVHWSDPVTVLRAEGPENLYNIAVCRDERRFVMLYETDDAKYVPFTFKYATSPELTGFERLPDAFYGREKYVGGPALYYESGTYYTLYLHDLGGRWETRITRSKDLVHWQDAPEDRPFLTFDFTRGNLPLRPPEAREVNASDVELCAWKGQTFIYFSGSDQQYAGDLQWAEFDGTPRQLLEHFFAGVPEPAPPKQ
jgi:alpha-L-fucosidase